MRRSLVVSIASLPILITPMVCAQEQEPGVEFEADRPGFSDGTGTVPPLRLQIESGFTFTNDSDDESWVLPQATLRFGITDWGEIFADVPSWNSTDSDGGSGTDEGLDDLTIGAKARLWDQSGARPAFALIAELTMPTGDHPFTTGDIEPEVRGAASWDLGSGFGLVVNASLGFPTEDDERWIEGTHSISLSIPITDRLGGFVEYYGFWHSQGGPAPEHYADGGLTYLLTPTMQIDVNTGVGLNGHADDYFVGGGLAILF